MIYIDIDGTVRDLFSKIEQTYGINRDQWKEWDTKIHGEGFCSFVTSDIELDSPLTEFGRQLKSYLFLTTPTKQRCDNFTIFGKEAFFLSGALHKKETLKWLSRHFAVPSKNVIFVEKTEDKYQYLKDCEWFIDDCPKLAAYPDLVWKWICIPQIYNVGLKCYARTDNFDKIRRMIDDSPKKDNL